MNVEMQPTPLAVERSDVLAALQAASRKTGSDFDYLLGTAMRESRLEPLAKSKGSSATGLFQFIDSTWLGLVKRFGERHGLGEYAAAIEETDPGHYTVSSHQLKSAILALRKDPATAALMAGEAANETKQSLECTLGRDVCGGELYAAHFLGMGGARRLIALNESNPGCPADIAFPHAASANRSIFYHADGSSKTVGEVYAWAMELPTTGGGAPASAAAQAKASSTSAAATTNEARDVPPKILPKPSLRGTAPEQDLTMAVKLARPQFASPMPTISPARELPSLPQSPLLLSPAVVEILSRLPLTGSASDRDS